MKKKIESVIQKELIFTEENCLNLSSTCLKISGIINLNIDGSFSIGQLMVLGSLIKDFQDNLIIKNSGIK